MLEWILRLGDLRESRHAEASPESLVALVALEALAKGKKLIRREAKQEFPASRSDMCVYNYD